MSRAVIKSAAAAYLAEFFAQLVRSDDFLAHPQVQRRKCSVILRIIRFVTCSDDTNSNRYIAARLLEFASQDAGSLVILRLASSNISHLTDTDYIDTGTILTWTNRIFHGKCTRETSV
eukprot:5313478-Pyramimonas_sp.AAC.1